MTKPLDLTRPVQTRDGRPVRILCTDKRGRYPIVGLIDCGDYEAHCTWTPDGTATFAEPDDDLINTQPRKVKQEGWVNLYKVGRATFAESNLFLTRADAIERRLPDHTYIEPGRIEWEEDEQ